MLIGSTCHKLLVSGTKHATSLEAAAFGLGIRLPVKGLHMRWQRVFTSSLSVDSTASGTHGAFTVCTHRRHETSPALSPRVDNGALAPNGPYSRERPRLDLPPFHRHDNEFQRNEGVCCISLESFFKLYQALQMHLWHRSLSTRVSRQDLKNRDLPRHDCKVKRS